MAPSHRLLVSGLRSTFTSLAFDPETHKLDVLAEYPAPLNATWVEPIFSASTQEVSRLVGLSETSDVNEPGMIYTFDIDHTRKDPVQHIVGVAIETRLSFAEIQVLVLHDGSAVAVATYLGGDLSLHPLTWSESTRIILAPEPPSRLACEFPYGPSHGPDAGRQRQCHWHQVIEDKRGLLYAPDLGSDRVWIMRREGLQAAVSGWLQCPGGSGPRHAAFNQDETILYVIGEMSHQVTAYDISRLPDGPAGVPPIESFAVNVIPPSAKAGHERLMDSAELTPHPFIPNVLYVSNRWEKRTAARQPELGLTQESEVPGDSIAIILLAADGRSVESLEHVRTQLDVVRGMRFSPDGRYIALAGQEGGGVEIYSVGGQRGELWTLVAALRSGIEGGLSHVVWL